MSFNRTSTTPWSEHVCWRCGAAADANCVWNAELVSATARGLDPLGYATKLKHLVSTVRVPVPRCRSCRSGSRNDSIIFVLSAALGAAAVLGLYWMLGRGSGHAPPFVLVDEELTMWLLGSAGVFVGALCAVPIIRRRKLPGARHYNDFPPIADLRAVGWDWPSTPD